ncbi:M56 family metallopeptidase [Spirosoma fluminis]
MNAIDFLTSPVAYDLGWSLLHAIWQGFALVLSAALALHIFRSRSSAFRYRIGVVTLFVQVLTSVITFVWCYRPSPSASELVFTRSAIQPAVSIHWQTVAQTVSWPQYVQQFLENHLAELVLAYLIGVAAFGLRLIGGWVYLQRLSRVSGRSVTAWIELSDRLRASLGIRMAVQVKESAQIAIPMVIGVLKPVVLLPVSLATNLSLRELEAVLAHELAHVKRFDYGVNLLQSVVEVLYFFHPALWWLSARVREEREHCCDDLAVQACGGDGRILAQALARVEELRLAQVYQTPTLAMAFVSKRKQLLHRVRRMLGVPTQPFVSNNRLAGLTLATLLLVSASVYAVQQQNPRPKPQATQQKTTRRHKAGNGTEYGMTDKQKVSYVIWKGQKLPATRVAKLQQQLDQVMAGQLSLDDVNQPDRDILLTIIETNVGFDTGMKALSESLAHIDYDNIVASALENVPLSPDAMVEGLAKVDYSAIINDAMASVGTFPALSPASSDSLNRLRSLRQHQVDSLSQLMEKNAQQAEAIRLQMEKLRFPVEESERSREVLEWRKNKLAEKRSSLLDKHRQLLYADSKQKLNQAEIEKQLEALEPEIKKQEIGIEELNKQIKGIEQKINETQEPLDKLERQAEELAIQMNQYATQLSAQHEGLTGLNIPMPAIPGIPARSRRAPRPALAPAAVIPPAPRVAPVPDRVIPTAPALAPTPPALRSSPALAPPPKVKKQH